MEQSIIDAVVRAQRDYNDNLQDLEDDLHLHKILQLFRKLSGDIVPSVMERLCTPAFIKVRPVQDQLGNLYDLKCGVSETLDHYDIWRCIFVNSIASEIDQHLLSEARDLCSTIVLSECETDESYAQDYMLLMKHIAEKARTIPSHVICTPTNLPLLERNFDVTEEYVGARFLNLRRHGKMRLTIDGVNVEQELFINPVGKPDELLVVCTGWGVPCLTYQPHTLLQAEFNMGVYKVCSFQSRFSMRVDEGAGNSFGLLRTIN